MSVLISCLMLGQSILMIHFYRKERDIGSIDSTMLNIDCN